MRFAEVPPPTWENLFYPPATYRYFEGVKTRRQLMVDAAILAYARFGSERIPQAAFRAILTHGGFPGSIELGDWSGGAKGTQAYFASNASMGVIAFRGTERDDWRDLVSDINLMPSDELRYHPRPPESEDGFWVPSLRCVLDHEIIGVHRGFQTALNEIWDRVAECLKVYREEHPTAEICFTGHSLGAALATIAASRFAGGNASLFTFGCPRTGNRKFHEAVRARTKEWLRFVNGDDLVTHLPPNLPWYEHDAASCVPIGAAQRLKADASELLFILKTAADVDPSADLQEKPPDALVDHSPARYAYWMWQTMDAAGAR